MSLNKNKYLNNLESSQLEQFLRARLPARDSLMLLLALKTGARASELLGVSKRDVDFYNGTVFVKGLKGSNDREIPLEPILLAALKTYSEGVEDKLFDLTYDRLYQVWCHYRTCEKKLHALRHTFAIQLYEKTRDIHMVRYALGHKSISNTMIYLDFFHAQEGLRKALVGA